MTICVRGGHNYYSTGASALINEVTEDRQVKDSLIKNLIALGYDVLDVTPGDMDTDNDLVYGVSKANTWGADLFISIHFNKAYDVYEGPLGTETYIYSKNDNITLDNEIALRIVNSIASLGFKNRGVKENKQLYELKATSMASIICEVCFAESVKDVELYRQIGAEHIGKVIAYAIANRSIEKKETRVYDMENLVCYCNQVDKRAAEYLADFLKCPCIDATLPFNYSSVAKIIIAVGGNSTTGTGFSGYTTKYITGADRYETIKEVLKYIGKL